MGRHSPERIELARQGRIRANAAKRAALTQITGTKVCTRCGKEKRWHLRDKQASEYTLQKRTYGDGTVGYKPQSACKTCLAKVKKDRDDEMRRDPALAAEFKRRRHRWNQQRYWKDPEAARAYNREKCRTPEYRARDRAYRRALRKLGIKNLGQLAEHQVAVVRAQIREQAAADKQQERALRLKLQHLETKAKLPPDVVEMLEIMAPLPHQVVQRYLLPEIARLAVEPGGGSKDQDLTISEWRAIRDRMRRGVYQPGDPLLGVEDFAISCRVAQRSVYRVATGESSVVTLDLVDKLFLKTDVTLDELTDAAREWAMLTNDPWPVGARGTGPLIKQLLKEHQAA